ncbi:MAG: DUF3737 family protein [Candidatus Enteromonas sp.]|nr:DUF3737 family protein [Candidatus Enteromonas sp.]
MRIIQGETYQGERPLFGCADAKIASCTFNEGESCLKETGNLEISQCLFRGKYPLWYGENENVTECLFEEGARAGIWYTSHSSFSALRYDAPKGFRHCQDISLRDITFSSPLETLWWNEQVTMDHLLVQGGTYFGKEMEQGEGNALTLKDSDYCFDGAKKVRLSRCQITSKDAFWNSEDCTLVDCSISGEYFGWNSKNLTLIRCTISSLQGFCYIDGLTLIDCVFDGVDRCFEYCSRIDARILSSIVSVKNPISGRILAKGIGEIIRDDPSIPLENTEIIVDESL